ncbi:MAG: tetratricopeptide repeat protein [Ignavibacteriae bacterium]|nr:tetratricopeptide repeat protein [Ignavibacteriota bacterium]
MSKTNELRIFISSTFRDLQEEREHLVKKIFPEIRALCRERGITFTEIDLRWGLTEEDAMLGQVIRTCLEEVDKCRPYFIGMIGSRYGWVPEFHEIMIDPDLLTKYPWIEEVALEGVSVTEMEFIHGVFDVSPTEGEYAFFYHREESKEEADDPEKLAALIERARSTGHPFRDFDSIEGLGEMVHDDLIAMIDQYWPVEATPTLLELERRAHTAFSANRTRAYIPNPLYLKEFIRWSAEGEKPLIVHGKSGLGKSSLVAYLTDYYRKKNPKAFVIEHYVGASQSSGSALSVMRHIIEEIRTRFSISEEIPTSEGRVERSFPNWLYRCEHLALQEGIEVLITIDAVNQLGESGRALGWLPRTIPQGIRLMISTTEEITEHRLAERGWENLSVTPLGDERVRQSIVIRYLGEFRKGISPEQMRCITNDLKGESPLYLRIVAEEMRLHGKHETLDDVIRKFVEADGLLEVFERVLERIEFDFGEREVRDLLSMIGSSLSGLSEHELMEITNISRLDLSRLLFAFGYNLIRRDGLLGFFHDYLRYAAERRYLSDPHQQREVHLRIARYFEQQDCTLRNAREMLWNYDRGGDDESLVKILARPEIVRLFYGTNNDTIEILKLWSRLRQDGYDPAEVYQRSLAQSFGDTHVGRDVESGNAIASVLERLGLWDAAIDIQQRLLVVTNKHGLAVQAARCETLIGGLLQKRGELGEARKHMSNAVELYREHGSLLGEWEALHRIGGIHWQSGEYDLALECFQRQLDISDTLEDPNRRSSAYLNVGLVHWRRGELEKALECFKTRFNSSQESGDVSSVATASSNMGIIYATRGDFVNALECFERQRIISIDLGDRQGLGLALGNLGVVYSQLGRYDRSLECCQQYLAIAEELGDRYGISLAVGNMSKSYMYLGEFNRAFTCYERGITIAEETNNRQYLCEAHGTLGHIYQYLGQYDKALEFYTLSIEGHRALGSRAEMPTSLTGSANLLLKLTEDGGAMPHYLPPYLPNLPTEETWRSISLTRGREQAEESIAIGRELEIPNVVFDGEVLIARIEAAEANVTHSLELLEGMLADIPAPFDEEEDHSTFTTLERQADLHYWLWRIQRGSQFDGTSPVDSERTDQHRVEALQRYLMLVEKIPKCDYNQRIDELSKITEQESRSAAG